MLVLKASTLRLTAVDISPFTSQYISLLVPHARSLACLELKDLLLPLFVVEGMCGYPTIAVRHVHRLHKFGLLINLLRSAATQRTVIVMLIITRF